MSSSADVAFIDIAHVRVSNGITQQGTFVIANVAVSGILIDLHVASVTSMCKGVEMIRVVLALFAIALAAAFARAQAACEPQWQPEFGFAGSAGPISAAKWWDPDGPGGERRRVLCLVSRTDNVFGVARLGSAVTWEPVTNTWTSLGAPTSDLVDVVIDGTNRLVAASSSHVYTRTESGWTTLGGSFNGDIRRLLASAEGRLIAVGAFTSIDGSAVDRVAEWNGTRWVVMGQGVNGSVNDIAQLVDGTIVIAGEFTTSGPLTTRYVARWSTVAGGSWIPTSSGLNAPARRVIALETGGFIVLGNFTSAGGLPVSRAAKWTGTWSNPGSEFSNLRDLLAVGDGEYLLVRSSTVALRWDGTNFIAIDVPPNGPSVAARLGSDDFFVSGNFSVQMHATIGVSSIGDFVARVRNGRVERLFSSAGFSSSVRDMAIDRNGQLLVVGDFVTAGTVRAMRAARWDGESWHATSPSFNGEVTDLSVLADRDIIAVGSFDTIVPNGTDYSPRVARWNGDVWLPVTRGGPIMESIRSVLELPNGDLLFGGSDLDSQLERWDGTDWVRTSLGNDVRVQTLARAPNGTVFAGSTAGLHEFDGVEWQNATPAGLLGTVREIAFGDDNTLLLGGQFIDATTMQPTSGVVRVVGSSWTPVGSIPFLDVHSIELLGPDVFVVVGTRRDASAGSCVFRWDSDRWVSLGIDVPMYGTLSLSSGDFYVCGSSLMPSEFGVRGLIRWTSTPRCECDSIDFNRNGTFPEPQDVIDYFDVLAGGTCSTGGCGDLDFNNNGVYPEDADVMALLNVLAGGACP